MSYTVLAVKWRPRRFEDLVGQQHVVRALVNSLAQDKLHHAYLFTGTRGVGKTTLARILAKALNCEQGVVAEPCGVCSACTAIDQGRFVDLLEVDAASRTKVDDTRELLDNVQYAPSRGRYKVYLIDEVHMLSNHSFNALLKTLEEPPPHVKFLLATTDPQKLPITVLSRCLQFNLKRLTVAQIQAQLEKICAAEGIAAEPEGLKALAKAADGSMRDALSMLDQGIAFCGGEIKAEAISAMLGTIDRGHVLRIIEALAAEDGNALLDEVEQLAERAPDFGAVLDDLMSALQQIAVIQLVGDRLPDEELDALKPLAERISPEDVQLFFQIALQGRRDLPVGRDPRVGLEMTLLRMLAFRPVAIDAGDVGSGSERVQRRAGSAAPSVSSASAPSARPTGSAAADDSVASPAPRRSGASAVRDRLAAQLEGGRPKPASGAASENAPTALSSPTEPSTRFRASEHTPHGSAEAGARVEASTETGGRPDVPAETRARPDVSGEEAPNARVSAESRPRTSASDPLPRASASDPRPPTSASDPQSRASASDPPTEARPRAGASAQSRPPRHNPSVAASPVDRVSERRNARALKQDAPAPDYDFPPPDYDGPPEPYEPAPSDFYADGAAPTASNFAYDAADEASASGAGGGWDGRWATLIQAADIRGAARQLADHCELSKATDRRLEVVLVPDKETLATQQVCSRLEAAISQHLGRPITLSIVTGKPPRPTPAEIRLANENERMRKAREAMEQDPNVKAAQEAFGAVLEADTIRPRNGD